MENSKIRVTQFAFENLPIRAVNRGDNLWFVAKDVCEALGLSNVSDAVEKLDEDERMTLALTDSHAGQRGGAQSILLVSESGLYALVLRCRDAMKAGSVPHRFRKWVTAEVLPTIRKTGAYGPAVDASGEAVTQLVGVVATLVARFEKVEARLDEADARQQEERERNRVEAKFREDQRLSGVTMQSVYTVATKHGVPRKGRGNFIPIMRRSLFEYCEKHGHLMGEEAPRSDGFKETLFPRDAVAAWLREEGHRMIASHLAQRPFVRRATGQSVIQFPKRQK